MNALTSTAITLLCVLILTVPRTWVSVVMAVGVLYLTQGQALDLAGFNLLPNRILVYVCFARVMARSEFSLRELNKADKALIVLYIYMTLILVLRPGESIPLRLAKMMDVLFGYLAFRGLIRNLDEAKSFLRTLVLLLIPFVAALAAESITAKNYFAVVGGNTVTWLREGSVRCFGSFRHPSLLGSVGATFFPLFVGLAVYKTERRRAVLGAILCLAVVFFSTSGGPLSAWATGVMALLVWRLRTKMRQIRWAIVATVAVLALVMKAPVWYLIARISSLTGGTGWHRAYLIEVAVNHLDMWWLFGIPISATNGWFMYNLAATGGADITNQYISYGLNAGLVGLALFLLYLTRLFSLAGRTMAYLREISPTQRNDEFLLWSMGAMLTVHLSNWLGITYWDQFSVFWVMQMAMISSVCEDRLRFASVDPVVENADDVERNFSATRAVPS